VTATTLAQENHAQTQPDAHAAQAQPAANTSNENGASVPGQSAPSTKAYEPLLPGVVLAPLPAKKDQSEPVFLRDNSIAESIRQRHSDDLARLRPILAATSEDHEEWLKERGTHNPTHRKVGMSVREEYEQWLMARALARSAPAPTDESTATPQP
jgi:hypothetical protein